MHSGPKKIHRVHGAFEKKKTGKRSRESVVLPLSERGGKGKNKERKCMNSTLKGKKDLGKGQRLSRIKVQKKRGELKTVQ